MGLPVSISEIVITFGEMEMKPRQKAPQISALVHLSRDMWLLCTYGPPNLCAQK